MKPVGASMMLVAEPLSNAGNYRGVPLYGVINLKMTDKFHRPQKNEQKGLVNRFSHVFYRHQLTDWARMLRS